MKCIGLRLLIAAALTFLNPITNAFAVTDAESPNGFLKGKLPDNAGALKRVAITTFVVQFVTQQSVEAKNSEVFYAQWDGVSPELMQATANALYARFTADLQAAGIAVVPTAEVEAHPALTELRKFATPNMAVANDSTLFKASTLVAANDLPILLHSLVDVRLGKYYTTAAEGTNQQLLGRDNLLQKWIVAGGVFDLAAIYGSQYKLSESLNSTAMGVRLVVPLINIGVQRKVGGFGVGLLDGGDYGLAVPNPRLVESGTVFSFIHSTGGAPQVGVLALQKPASISDMKVEIVQTDRYRDRSMFRRTDSGLLGALSRAAGTSNTTPHLLVKPDPAEFQKALLGAGGAVFKELVQTLTAPR